MRSPVSSFVPACALLGDAPWAARCHCALAKTEIQRPAPTCLNQVQVVWTGEDSGCWEVGAGCRLGAEDDGDDSISNTMTAVHGPSAPSATPAWGATEVAAFLPLAGCRCARLEGVA